MASVGTSLVARPMDIDLEAEKTAVVIVDMQNHFVALGGTWARCGVDTAPVQAVVPAIQRVIGAARTAGVLIVYVRSPCPGDPSTTGMPPEAFRGQGRDRWAHYVASVGGAATRSDAHSPTGDASPTWNADILTELTPEPKDVVITKRVFSGFRGTELDETLRASGITTLLFTGCTTSVCVDSTLRDGMFRGYDCVLLEDCVAEPIGARLPRSNHDATVLVTELVLGWVSDSTAVAQAFEGWPAPRRR